MPKADRQVYEAQFTHTRCQIEFHSNDNPNAKEIVIGGGKSDPNIGNLVSVRTSKAMEGASGTFTFTTKRDPSLVGAAGAERPALVSLLRFWPDPESVWVRITWIVDGQRSTGMIGIIDSIRESVSRGPDGSRTEVYTIVGRDIGKVFETTKLWLHPFDPGKVGRSILAYITSMGEELQGTPSHFVQLLLETWIGNNGLSEHQWLLPVSLGSNSFFEFMEQAIQNMDEGHGLLFDPTLLDVEELDATLWDSLLEYSNGILNEIWVDVGPDPKAKDDPGKLVPTFYMRERPFPTFDSRKRWESITKRILQQEDVTGRQISKGGAANRFNFWTIGVDGKLAIGQAVRYLIQAGAVDGAPLGEPGNIPIVNFTSVQRDGLRKWERETKYAPLTIKDKKEGFLNVLANWLRRCHDWYAPGPFHLSGTLPTSRLMPEIRIGERILENRPDGVIDYYCEGVDQAWEYPNAGSSVITVTRGEYIHENHLGTIYEQIKSSKALTALQSCLIPSEVEGYGDGATGIGVADLAALEGIPAPGDSGNDGFIDKLLQGCRMESPKLTGAIDNAAGFADFDVSGGASALAEVGGSALLSEGGTAGGLGGADLPPSNPHMVPDDDAENVQARKLAAGDVGAKKRTPGLTEEYGEKQLEEDAQPLSEEDSDDLNDDPYGGLTAAEIATGS